MTSKIVVNNIESDAGVSTVFFNSDIGGTGGTLNVDGNLNVDGVLSYEDVTNIDSVGLVTARNGLHVTSGDVAIGNANPDLKLHVNGVNALPSSSGSTPTGHLTLRAKSTSSSHGMFMGVSNAAPWSSWIQAQDANNNATNYPLLLNPNGGNIGIGEDNPQNSLHISGSSPAIRFGDTGSNGSAFSIIEDNDGLFKIRNDAGNSGTGSGIAFEVDAAERVRIDNAGRLLIGRTTALASSAERLTIDDGMAMFRRSSTNAAAVYIRNEDSTADTRHPYLIFTDGSGNRGGFGIQNDSSSLWISGQNGIAFRTSGSAPSQEERLRITSAGDVGIGENSPADRLVVQKTNANGDVGVRIKNDTLTDGSASTPTTASLYLNTSTADFNTFYIQARRYDNDTHFGYADPRDANHVPAMCVTNDNKLGINDSNPLKRLSINNGTTDSDIISMYNDNVGINFGAWGTGHGSYPREATINGTRFDNGSAPFLRIGGQGGIKFCVDMNTERMRITPSGEVNIGGSDLNTTAYAFQVSRDLGTPSASGSSIARFRNANGTYSQDLYLKFNNSKDIIWGGGSGNGGMTWQMGTRGYNWEIGGTNKFGLGPSSATLNGTTDGILNLNTTDGRGSFIRFQENGASKVWVGSAEGMGVGDQDDACLMSVDNIYFRNSTDSRTTLTVSKEGRLTGEKAYPDASGTLRSNPYYPPTNQYQTYSAPSGGNKWLRFGYFSSRGRYRVTFNSTGGYYSPGSVTFDFNLYWASPHVYVGNVSKLSTQYVTQFRVTSDSNGGNYYGEVYVSVNGNQTGSHIHCTAQVLGMADREFNLHNYGYDLSNLTYTSGNFGL
jgi:hypothetical protein